MYGHLRNIYLPPRNRKPVGQRRTRNEPECPLNLPAQPAAVPADLRTVPHVQPTFALIYLKIALYRTIVAVLVKFITDVKPTVQHLPERIETALQLKECKRLLRKAEVTVD